jgi:hypothetical protein
MFKVALADQIGFYTDLELKHSGQIGAIDCLFVVLGYSLQTESGQRFKASCNAHGRYSEPQLRPIVRS